MAGNGNDQGFSFKNTLYFYFFIVILPILLLAILLMRVKTYFALRAEQRSIEEQIRNGTWVSRGDRQAKDAKQRDPPKMWEVSLQLEEGMEKEGQHLWENVTPLSVLPLDGTSTEKTPITSPQPAVRRARRVPSFYTIMHEFGLLVGGHLDTETAMVQHIERQNRQREAEELRENRRNPSSSRAAKSATPPPPQVEIEMTSTTPPTPTPLQTAVLIAMPTQGPSLSSLIEKKRALATSSTEQEEESDLPHLEVGITEVSVLGGLSEDRRPTAQTEER